MTHGYFKKGNYVTTYDENEDGTITIKIIAAKTKEVLMDVTGALSERDRLFKIADDFLKKEEA